MKHESIQYGRYSNSEWRTINGLESIRALLDKIRTEINWDMYQLWVHGSILSNVDTHDVDMTILGPVIPNRINEILDEAIRIGFDEQIYVDIKYSMSNELYDPVLDPPKTILYACYRPKITIDGTTYNYGRAVKDLYLKETRYPMAKTLDSTIQYKSPIRVI